METSLLKTLELLGLKSKMDFKSYLHLRGYVQVMGLRVLVGVSGRAFSCKEYNRSAEIFVNTEGTFLNLRFDALDKLVSLSVVKDLT